MRIDADVLKVIENASVSGNELLLTGTLERSMYVKVNKILEVCGFKWNKKAKRHICDKDASDRIDEIILTGQVEVPKDEFNFFPSPDPVVEHLLYLAEITPGLEILEPSAGTGNIASKLLEQGAIVDCIELCETNYNKLLEHGKYRSVKYADFLLETPIEKYDRVVMNPPFCKQQDIRHVNHAMGFLKTGGILVSVMSASVNYRSNKLTTAFREFVENSGGIIDELPPESFKASGTKVNTVIVKIVK